MNAENLKTPKRGAKDGNYELLAKALVSKATEKLSYKPPFSYKPDTINRTAYRRILIKIEELGSSIEEFSWFVFQHDWGWLSDGVPSPLYIGKITFLESFSWYINHKQQLSEAGTILDNYDKEFNVQSNKGLEELKAAFKIKCDLESKSISPTTFFNYVHSISWRSFNGTPPITFLATEKFLKQFYTYLGKTIIPTRTTTVTKHYLTKILEKLNNKPVINSEQDFEDFNWEVAELIFEPLQNIVFKNGRSSQLKNLVNTVVNEKELSSFGKYVVTEDGLLTPLGAYWIGSASLKLKNFYVDKQWKSTLIEYIHPSVYIEGI